jgi:cyclohexyl-isocyanide hydratase
MQPITVAFLVYPNVTQLDFTGPAQVLSRLGNATMHFVWRNRDLVSTDSGFAFPPTATFEEIKRADVLCVPGGFGCADVMDDPETLGWVHEVGSNAQWVTSVCTGSLILGAAGLLRGYRATSHWDWRDHLVLFGAEPVEARVVFDRNRVTGGGVTAGIDFALMLTAAIAGEEYARAVQLGLEYDPQPPFDSGDPHRVEEELVEKVRQRTRTLAPDRETRIRAAAERLSSMA